MDFERLVTSRHSVRTYQDRPVEPEKVEAILEAGRLAPSACNNQPTRVVVCDTPELRAAAGRATGRFDRDGSVFGAPLVLVVCCRRDEAWVRRYDEKNHGDVDATIVCDQMMMQATDLRLGTCWVCHFDPEAMRAELGLPAGVDPVNVLTVGYADEEPVDMQSHLFGRRIDAATFRDPARTAPAGE